MFYLVFLISLNVISVTITNFVIMNKPSLYKVIGLLSKHHFSYVTIRLLLNKEKYMFSLILIINLVLSFYHIYYLINVIIAIIVMYYEVKFYLVTSIKVKLIRFLLVLLVPISYYFNPNFIFISTLLLVLFYDLNTNKKLAITEYENRYLSKDTMISSYSNTIIILFIIVLTFFQYLFKKEYLNSELLIVFYLIIKIQLFENDFRNSEKIIRVLKNRLNIYRLGNNKFSYKIFYFSFLKQTIRDLIILCAVLVGLGFANNLLPVYIIVILSIVLYIVILFDILIRYYILSISIIYHNTVIRYLISFMASSFTSAICFYAIVTAGFQTLDLSLQPVGSIETIRVLTDIVPYLSVCFLISILGLLLVYRILINKIVR